LRAGIERRFETEFPGEAFPNGGTFHRIVDRGKGDRMLLRERSPWLRIVDK
jgi:hypothetical protein